MLALRPNCELCDKDLPPEAMDAMICTYECTFCAHCVDTHLQNVCPNCGGGFCARPIRTATAWREGVSRVHQPSVGRSRPSEVSARRAGRIYRCDQGHRA